MYYLVTYEKMIAYVNDPEQLSETADKIGEVLGENIGVSTQDTMYQKMKLSMIQTERVTMLVFALTVVTSVFVTLMLLCMWMRNRKVEIAVFVGLGISKIEVFMQMLTEIVLIYSFGSVLAAIGFYAVTPLLSEIMGNTDGVSIKIIFSVWNVWKIWGMGVIVLILITLVAMLPCFRKKIKETLSEMEG